jgi:hypothetical protein
MVCPAKTLDKFIGFSRVAVRLGLVSSTRAIRAQHKYRPMPTNQTNGTNEHNGTDPASNIDANTHRALEQQSDQLIVELVQLLEHTSLSCWKKPLLTWLAGFAGMENELMRAEETPAFQVYHCMAAIRDETAEQIAVRLSVLDFLTWRFADPTNLSIRWDFRRESLADFGQRIPAYRVWQSDTEYPEPLATQTWLLEQYTQAGVT